MLMTLDAYLCRKPQYSVSGTYVFHFLYGCVINFDTSMGSLRSQHSQLLTLADSLQILNMVNLQVFTEVDYCDGLLLRFLALLCSSLATHLCACYD